MKRYGNLFERICSFENLLLAARKAFRGKTGRMRVANFYFHTEPELLAIQEELLSGAYRSAPYRTFQVREPKRRLICAADFRDRVVHHAICNVLDPIFERRFIQDTYACRKEKGSHRAIRRAQGFLRRYRFFLKGDVSKFFGTVDHSILMELLRRVLKDERLLRLLETIVRLPVPGSEPGKGLPIGNLTSQYFANFYLGRLDYLVKDNLRWKGYVRYMDDFVVFGDDKPGLHGLRAAIQRFLHDELALRLKEEGTFIAPSWQGLPFLGFRIFPGLIRIKREGWKRYTRKIHARGSLYTEGGISEEQLVASAHSLVSHVAFADSRRLRQTFEHRRRWVGTERKLEPRQTWRQLEQQRPELPVGESQQQLARQPQQQHRGSPSELSTECAHTGERVGQARRGSFTDGSPAPASDDHLVPSRSAECGRKEPAPGGPGRPRVRTACPGY